MKKSYSGGRRGRSGGASVSRDHRSPPEPSGRRAGGTSRAAALPLRLSAAWGGGVRTGQVSAAPTRDPIQGPPRAEPLGGLGAAPCCEAAGPARLSGTTRAGGGGESRRSRPLTPHAGPAPGLARGPSPPSATARSGVWRGRLGAAAPGRPDFLLALLALAWAPPGAAPPSVRVQACGSRGAGPGVRASACGVRMRVFAGSGGVEDFLGLSLQGWWWSRRQHPFFRGTVCYPCTRGSTGSLPKGTVQQGSGLVPGVHPVGLGAIPPTGAGTLTSPAGVPSHRSG